MEQITLGQFDLVANAFSFTIATMRSSNSAAADTRGSTASIPQLTKKNLNQNFDLVVICSHAVAVDSALQ